MKKFILNFIYVCVIILIVSIAIEIALLYRTNMYSYKHKYVMTHLNDINVLLMGNSHIANGLIPDSIGYGVFNTATSGRPAHYDIELLKQYVPQIRNLKVVVMPLDYAKFYLGRERPNPRFIQRTTDRENSARCVYFKYMNVKDDFWYWSEILNSKDNFMHRFIEDPEQARCCDSLGYQILKISKRRANWEHGHLPKLVDYSMPKNMKNYNLLYEEYSTIAKITQQKNVRLILVGTPLYKTYHEDMNKDVVKEVHDFAAKLKKEFPNVEYYDFSFDNRFVPKDFNDAGHLSEFGAAKFSKIMKGIIENHAQ